MIENSTDTQNSTQAAQIKDLDQQIATKRALLAEQQDRLRWAQLRFRTYSTANRSASAEQNRRKALWAKIVEQPHHTYLDSGQLSNGSLVDLVLNPHDESRTEFIHWQLPNKQDPSEQRSGEQPPTNQASEQRPEEQTAGKQNRSEQDEAPQIDYSEIVVDRKHAYLPQQFDRNLLESTRIPIEVEEYESVADLITKTSQLILRCVSVTDTDARLLAHFVLATWLIDRLPVAPYLAVVGPPQSGKTTLLRVLHLLCRRPLFASDATSLTLLHACHHLHPTLLIDETSSIDNPVAMRRLLRVGNTPDGRVLRHKQPWNVFGAKVICWRELPDDAALNSRCIILPMHAVNDPALRLPDDPEVVEAAATLQSQLLYYRLANYARITKPANDESIKTLPPRTRELYLALATPCAHDEPSRSFLVDYFLNKHSREHSEDALSPAELAVLTALFQSMHMQDHRGELFISHLTEQVNRQLRTEGERLRVGPRQVGPLLTSFGFVRRHRLPKGMNVVLDTDDQRRLHDVTRQYGLDHLPEDVQGISRCSLCPSLPPATTNAARTFAIGVIA